MVPYPSSLPLEVKACVACAVGERLDAPVIEKAAAVEDDLRDARGRRPLAEQAPDGRRHPHLGAPFSSPSRVRRAALRSCGSSDEAATGCARLRRR